MSSQYSEEERSTRPKSKIRKKRITLRNQQHEDIKDNVKSTWRRNKRMNQINLQKKEEDHMSFLIVQNRLQHLLYIILQRITKHNIKKKTTTQFNWEERRGSPTNFNYKKNDKEVKQIYNTVNLKRRRKKKMTQLNQLTERVETTTSVSTDVNIRNKQNTSKA